MPRALQPLVLSLAIVTLLALRFIPEIDPVRRTINGWLGQSNHPLVDASRLELQDLEAQIEELKHELDFKNSTDKNLLSTNVTGKTVASFRQALRIGAGSDDGVSSGAAVFAGGVLIGRIDSVEPDAATVLLIGDPDILIPVVIGSGRVPGIIRPQAGGVVIDDVAGVVETGEAVVTSGISGLYSPGWLVGGVGEKLSGEVLVRYVLERPLRAAEIRYVQVAL